MNLLRKANLDDIDELIKFRIHFLKEIQDCPSDEEIKTFRKSLKDYFLEKMKSNEFIAWLAESDNEIIATSGLSFLQKPPHFINMTGKFAYIMNMYTKPEWRRKGIGSELLEKLFEEIKQNGIQPVVLHSTPTGRPLYEKYGLRDNDGDKEMILKL
ncbi:MAG: GNAT family N-acetyltransferase [Candidatus Lokiarchaeota archaeon]|nr:GNAT family N-acetyltransferase [Candidatus Lokiarchaeota archaeon]